jgi:hypothetical protein
LLGYRQSGMDSRVSSAAPEIEQITGAAKRA